MIALRPVILGYFLNDERGQVFGLPGYPLQRLREFLRDRLFLLAGKLSYEFQTDVWHALDSTPIDHASQGLSGRPHREALPFSW